MKSNWRKTMENTKEFDVENYGKILLGSGYWSVQRKTYSWTFGKWKDGIGGNLSFPKWNDRSGWRENLGY